MTVLLTAGVFCLFAASLSADTYRWKDKEGKVHYGEAVPAEYADQPYDVLNNAGIVIDHVDDTTISEEVREAKKQVKKRAPLISEKERQIQSDRLLVIQYRSEDEIEQALELEIAQLGYDKRIINQSYESTNEAIRNQIMQAADQQRAGLPISAVQQKSIADLYARRSSDEKKRLAMNRREERIRARFKKNLERYRILTAGEESANEEPTDQG